MSIARWGVGVVIAPLILTSFFAGGPPAAGASRCDARTSAAPPSPGSVDNKLLGVSVLSPCNAWAVGTLSNTQDITQTLIEHWNGAKWRQVPSPNLGGSSKPNNLNAVTALSPKDVWAVGDHTTGTAAVLPAVQRWNGSQWKSVSIPTPKANLGSLYGVAAASASDVWAVGETCPGCATDETLTYHWDGKAWTQIASPNPTDFAALRSVSVVNSHDVWAVGDYFNGTATQSLIEHWNGTAWKRVPSPDPAGATNQTILFGVSAASARNAWAVGKYFDGNSTTQTLVLRWNGRAWRDVASPNPSTTNNALSGVVTLSRRRALAVGEAVNSSHASQTLIERWNGRRWKQVASPDPGTSTGFNALFAVGASSSSNAWAVGSYSDGTVGRTLAVHRG